MDIYAKKNFLFPYYSFFLVFKHAFIRCADVTVSQVQTQQVMTSQIRPHTQYLIQILKSKLMKNLAIVVVLLRVGLHYNYLEFVIY